MTQAMEAAELERPATRGEVPSVAAAIRILRHLAQAGAPVGVTPLARALGLNTSTCFNILRTLAGGELVRFDAEAKTYALDYGVVDLARAAFAQGAELGHILPMMRQLALRHGVTVTLWRPAGPDRMVLTLVAESDQVMRIRMGVGQRLPLLIGAMGRVAGAFGGMDEGEMRRRFEALRWQRPLSFAEFLEQVAETRARGWALDEGQYVLGVTTLSAPVVAPGALSAISATMFTGQHDGAAMARIGGELARLGADIQRAMTFD
jgi:DNA-binding IclR family transcriptional regulator